MTCGAPAGMSPNAASASRTMASWSTLPATPTTTLAPLYWRST